MADETLPAGELPAPVGQLSDVLPAVLLALAPETGPQLAPEERERLAKLRIPACKRAIVVLVDGLGARLLADRAAYAPYLAGLLRDGSTLRCGFPSTTATSLASFGTGLPPGGHGMFGYLVLDPETDRLFNELSWENGPDPQHWQSSPPVFERSAGLGIATFQIGPSFFNGSGLTTAALRGAQFVGAQSLDDRIDAAASVVRSAARTLVYVYWGDVDKVGHGMGCGSAQWIEELQAVDIALRQLAARVPADTAIVVTADHGMVDSPMDRRIDLADGTGVGAHLARGVRLSGGEPRAPMLYCDPGEAPAVLNRWRTELGDDFDVMTRDEAVAAGWFGQVRPDMLRRVGDVIAAARSDAAIHDTRVQRVEQLRLVGLHGSRTADEVSIPLLVVPPRG